MPERSPGLIERYRPYLPVTPSTPVVTLAEGWTPLLPAPRLARALELPVELYLKVEGANPTGSFKDRGMTVAVSLALEAGARAVVCASTGNTSASAAAYAARAGLQAVVLIPRGAVARGKLAQAVHLGARVLEVEGTSMQPSGWSGPWLKVSGCPSGWSTRSTPTGSRARRRPPSRCATSWAAPPTCWPCPWATRGTSPPTGGLPGVCKPTASSSGAQAAGLSGRRGRAHRAGGPVAAPRRWPPPSASATRPRGGAP